MFDISNTDSNTTRKKHYIYDTDFILMSYILALLTGFGIMVTAVLTNICDSNDLLLIYDTDFYQCELHTLIFYMF